MQKVVPLALAIALIVLGTVAQGVYSYRFVDHEPTRELALMAQKLSSIPQRIGNWTGEDEQVDQRVELVAGIAGGVNRTYRHPNGDVVSVALVCGDRRNMTTHTPERCFAASGFTMAAAGARVYNLPLARNERGDIVDTVRFLTATFRKEDAESGRLLQQVFWAWNADGEWIAPGTDPRFPEWLGGLPRNKSWYKLYILCPLERTFDARYTIEDTAAYRFAEEFLPVLQRELFSGAEPGAADGGA